MFFKIINSLFLNIGDRTNNNLENAPTLSKQDKNSTVTELELWNIVTDYGNYQEVWSIYRDNGLLEAIKSRDEKREFDSKLSEIVNSQPSPQKEADKIRDLEVWKIITCDGK